MSKILVIAVILLATASFALGQASRNRKQSSSVTQIIMQTEREWADAYVKRDVETLGRILASDFISADYEGTVRDKTQYLETVKSHGDQLASITIEETQVRVYGNTAVSTGRYTVKGSNERGEPISVTDRYTIVYVKEQGRWQAVASHLSHVAQQ